MHNTSKLTTPNPRKIVVSRVTPDKVVLILQLRNSRIPKSRHIGFEFVSRVTGASVVLVDSSTEDIEGSVPDAFDTGVGQVE